MRWNGIIVGSFSIIALAMVFAIALLLILEPSKSEAHWGAVMACLGFIGGFLAGSWNTAHMRFDESPPQMPVEDALKLVEMAKS